MVEVMHNFFVQIFHGAHDVAFGFGLEAEILAYATCHAYAFLSAPVLVEGTVARWLIGVEVTLEQEARYAMLQYAQIARIVAFGAVACA